MQSQSSHLIKPQQKIQTSSNMEQADVAQQFIAEIGFSCWFDNTSNAPRQQHMNKKQPLPCTERITPSPIGFGQRIDGYKVLVDSFQQVKDRNGLSWWYDTSDDSDDNTDQ
jgi:antibiotic biosynthesis monooxygenase (ABM) superfamily enzyme